MTRRNDPSASSIPAATQRVFIEPYLPALHTSHVARASEIIDPTQFVVVSVAASVPVTFDERLALAEAVHVEHGGPAASPPARVFAAVTRIGG